MQTNQYVRAALMVALLLTGLCTAYAQTSISGTVTDQQGTPLIGVNVLVVGTSSGTVSDIDGSYTITAAPSDSLRFSYLGYAPRTLAVGGQSTIDVQLLDDADVLEEVVVVGYGSTRREAITGAISTVDAEEASALVVNNVGDALQGRMAGVQVITPGTPGENPRIQVRGIGSINFGSGPLIVVDGFPEAGQLNEFDTRDVASVNVLKDASATAVYGSRGSNGVIIIETKKGRAQDGLDVRFHSTVGVQGQDQRYDLLNTEQYIDYAEAWTGSELTYLDNPINSESAQTVRQTQTDWQDEIFQSGFLTQNNLQLAGGNERSTFFSSIGYTKQEGILINTPFDRYNFRLNSTHDITSDGKFRFGQTLYVSQFDRRQESRNDGVPILQHTVASIPFQPVFNPDNIGGYSGAMDFEGNAGSAGNPVLFSNLLFRGVNNLRLLGTAFLEYEPLEGLTLTGFYGGSYEDSRSTDREDIYESTTENELKTISKTTLRSYSPIYRAQANYDRLLGDHSLNVTVVGEIQDRFTDLITASGTQSTNNLDNIEGGDNRLGSSGNSRVNLQSFVTRATYGFKGRYYATFSYRRDGSSLLAPGNNEENFPAAAVGWNISEEPFMQNNPISLLKLRGSYGKTGSLGIGPYTFQNPIIQTIGPVFGLGSNNMPVEAFTESLGNEDLVWETTTMANVGLDLGFLNNRLNFSMEYYNRDVDNLILAVDLPGSSGLRNTLVNVGAMQNSGFEFQGQYYGNQSGDFRWNVSFNLSTNTNEVTRLVREGDVILANNSGRYTGDYPANITQVGDPVFSFYGFRTMGIFQSEAEIAEAPTQENAAPGDIRFVDLDGDGEITDDDRTIIGSYLPDFTYGLNFRASYSNFDFTVFFAGSQGNDIYNGMRSFLTASQRLHNKSVEVLDSWTPTNTNTDVPRIVQGDPNNNRRVSDRFVEDGSYLRLRGLTVGYRIPFGGATDNSLRLYVTGQNLFTITGYSGLTPEVSGGNASVGFDTGQYPQPRAFLFGAQLDL